MIKRLKQVSTWEGFITAAVSTAIHDFGNCFAVPARQAPTDARRAFE